MEKNGSVANSDHNNARVRYTIYGRLEKATAEFDDALRLLDHQVQIAYNNGVTNINLGEFQRAIEDFGEVIRLDPQHTNAFLNRGACYGYLGEHQRAVEDFSEVIRLDPHHFFALVNRALAYTTMCRDLEARQDVEAALEVGSSRVALETAIEEAKRLRVSG